MHMLRNPFQKESNTPFEFFFRKETPHHMTEIDYVAWYVYITLYQQ